MHTCVVVYTLLTGTVVLLTTRGDRSIHSIAADSTRYDNRSLPQMRWTLGFQRRNSAWKLEHKIPPHSRLHQSHSGDDHLAVQTITPHTKHIVPCPCRNDGIWPRSYAYRSSPSLALPGYMPAKAIHGSWRLQYSYGALLVPYGNIIVGLWIPHAMKIAQRWVTILVKIFNIDFTMPLNELIQCTRRSLLYTPFPPRNSGLYPHHGIAGVFPGLFT